MPSTDRDIEVLVAGHVCLDIIPRFPDRQFSPQEAFAPGRLIIVEEATVGTGGPVSNTGLALAKLGVRVTLAARVGRDDFGRLVRERLARAASDEGIVESPASSTSYTCVIAPPGVDRIFFHSPGANDDFGAEDVDAALCERARLFHFGYPPLMKRIYSDGGRELTALFEKAKRAGATTSLDMALPDPQSDAGRVDWREILKRSLPHVDLFHPSIEEGLYMVDPQAWSERTAQAGGAGLVEGLEGEAFSALSGQFLEWGAAVVTLKAGPRGFYVRTAGADRLSSLGAARPADPASWARREIWSPAFRPPAGGSATGSGDCSLAGFLTAFLRGLTAESAAGCGNAMGWQNLHALDAIGGIQDWPATQRIASDLSMERLAFEPVTAGWRFEPEKALWIGPQDGAGRS